MTTTGSMRFRKKMSPLPNMTTAAMLNQRAETKRENISKSRNRLQEIAKQKEKQQYDSYMSNINQLNQMKIIFKDLYPVFEKKEA